MFSNAVQEKLCPWTGGITIMMQACLAFVPHKVLNTEIGVFRFHGKGFWKSTHAHAYMNITPTWSQRYWHKRILNFLMDMSKTKSFVFKKADGVLMAVFNILSTLIHVEKCLLPETRAFPSSKWTMCCLLYVLAQTPMGLAGMTSTDRCDQLVSKRAQWQPCCWPLMTRRKAPEDINQNSFWFLQDAVSSAGCIFTTPKFCMC